MPTLVERTKRQLRTLRRMQREMWTTGADYQRNNAVHLFRTVAIVYRGVFDNKLFSRAAALSYSSLLALGPVIGIVVLLVGTFMRGNAEQRIKEAIIFAIPSLEDYLNLPPESGGYFLDSDPLQPSPLSEAEGGPPSEELPENVSQQEVATALDILIERIVDGVNQTIGGVNAGGGGVAVSIGGIILIWIGISLLVAVEGAFNDIWGVREGRTWGNRIVIYWAVLSLGALVGFALIGFLSASTVAGVLDAIPLADELPVLVAIAGPTVSFVGLTLLLMIFYKFFPNTHVRTRPALVGGLIVALLLVVNNLLSILYINQVIRIQSLYGSVGIILVLMFGLFLFWVFLLLGGQITYALQNVGFLANQRAWNNVSLRTRETITFAAFIIVCRRFAASLPPLSSDEIADMIRVPNNIVNESLTRLTQLELLMPVRGREEDAGERSCFVPSRPLKKITLASFKRMYSCQGSNEGTDLVRRVDPLVESFRERMDTVEGGELGDHTIDQLLEEFPTDPPLLPKEIQARQAEEADRRASS